MIDQTTQQIIERIHAHATKLVFEFAGAGSLALFWLHSVGGSSRTILEATDRYAAPSLSDLIGKMPDKFVSQDTVGAMVLQAYRRARYLTDEQSCIGVACTASIATDRTKRGEHGCWVAVYDGHGISSYGLVLTKGQRQRYEEEAVVSQVILHSIATACQLEEPLPLDLLAGEQLETAYQSLEDPLIDLLSGAAQSLTVHANGVRVANQAVHGALLSGSFNPLHQGHERLAQAAATLLELPVSFELPVVNADKPTLSYAEIERRLAQFRARYDVVLSRAPLFSEKATLFPGCVFIIGYDTVVRLVDLKYYAGEAGRDTALRYIQERGCRFLVAGRVQDDSFKTLADVAIPTGFEELFLELPEELFRTDLSSTELRRWGTQQ